jgi:hypothetical protein
VDAGVDRLPDAAGRGAHVIGIEVAGHAGHGGDAVAHRTDVAESQRGGLCRIDGGRRERGAALSIERMRERREAEAGRED